MELGDFYEPKTPNVEHDSFYLAHRDQHTKMMDFQTARKAEQKEQGPGNHYRTACLSPATE